MKKLQLILLGFILPSICFAMTTASENQMRAYLKANQASQLNYLKKLVSINSGTENINGVMRVGELLRPEFEKLGFKTTWFAEPKHFNRAATLVAEHPGKGKRILLIGHLDTVFPAQSHFQQMTMVKDQVKGPGVVDDKGGLVIILYALKAMQAANVLKDAAITVVLTGDEEDSGKPAMISRKPLIDAAKQSDVALDFEEAVSMDTASIARRGFTGWSVTATGKEAHSSAIFQKNIGAGAIFELARILNTMRIELSIKDVTFNPGLIFGGTNTEYQSKASGAHAFGKTNVIAKTATVKGEFRYLTLGEKEAMKTQMRAIVNQHLPGTQASINFQDGIPAMSPTSANLALLKEYSKVSVDLGGPSLTVLDPNSRGAGDISYVANIVPANLVGLGPRGWETHSVGETLDWQSIPTQTERAAVLMHRLAQASN